MPTQEASRLHSSEPIQCATTEPPPLSVRPKVLKFIHRQASPLIFYGPVAFLKDSSYFYNFTTLYRAQG